MTRNHHLTIKNADRVFADGKESDFYFKRNRAVYKIQRVLHAGELVRCRGIIGVRLRGIEIRIGIFDQIPRARHVVALLCGDQTQHGKPLFALRELRDIDQRLIDRHTESRQLLRKIKAVYSVLEFADLFIQRRKLFLCFGIGIRRSGVLKVFNGSRNKNLVLHLLIQ